MIIPFHLPKYPKPIIRKEAHHFPLVVRVIGDRQEPFFDRAINVMEADVAVPVAFDKRVKKLDLARDIFCLMKPIDENKIDRLGPEDFLCCQPMHGSELITDESGREPKFVVLIL